MAGASLGIAFVTPWIGTVSWRSTSLLMAGPWVGAASVVSLGLARLTGMAGLALLALLILLAPDLRAVVAALLGRHPHPPAPHNPAPARTELSGIRHHPSRLPALELDQTFVVPDKMSDEDLCQAWRSSYVALSRATMVSSLLRIVQMRALYLDELERRAGPGLQAWLRSGARAAGDPSRTLTAGDADRAIDVETS